MPTDCLFITFYMIKIVIFAPFIYHFLYARNPNGRDLDLHLWNGPIEMKMFALSVCAHFRDIRRANERDLDRDLQNGPSSNGDVRIESLYMALPSEYI